MAQALGRLHSDDTHPEAGDGSVLSSMIALSFDSAVDQSAVLVRVNQVLQNSPISPTAEVLEGESDPENGEILLFVPAALGNESILAAAASLADKVDGLVRASVPSAGDLVFGTHVS